MLQVLVLMDEASKGILVWRQMSNINLKINNNSLIIRKTY